MDGDENSGSLTAAEAEWLDAVRSTESLSALRGLTGTESEHDAYMAAREQWRKLRGIELGEPTQTAGIPGDSVSIGGREFLVHGITHADTPEERSFLREYVSDYIEAGETVYCEQGIRPMYFEDMPEVCEIDDYRWAMHHCRTMEVSSHVDGFIEAEFDENSSGIGADIGEVRSQFREVTFSLIESGTDVYGDRFASVLGDVASDFLMDHENIGTADDFASFAKSKQAARSPEQLADLQQYYNRVFLPQPIEREWLRRHDPELELFTHARNERIAEYVLYHGQNSDPVHVIVGAAHQPGVTYYLEGFRNGTWDFGEYEAV